jgi:glycine/D-amino acid oxidase-like deaminating enzyme
VRVAVLGAGLQGACAALELASRDIRVDLYEQEAAAMTQASSNNEGKLHLGYVYAKDPTGRTAEAMVAGALAFAPLLRRWLGSRAEAIRPSAPFHYALHRASQIDADAVERHLRRCAELVRRARNGAASDYFGSDCGEAPRRLTPAELESLYDPSRVRAAFRTPEISVDPEDLSREIRARLAEEPAITPRFGCRVRGVDTRAARPVVTADCGGGVNRDAYDHVVNALWAGRLVIDGTAGVRPPRPWLFRTKRFIRVRGLPAGSAPPSTTVVLGPFGDVTRYANGDVYLSWYPAALAGVSAALAPPAFDGIGRIDWRRATLDALSGIVPSLSALGDADLARAHAGGGVIFAWGRSDIDDPASELHARSAIGPESFGRYHTINTGKLTTAPLFARAMADHLQG